MSNFTIKTISIKECARCRTTWCAERVALEPHEQVNFVKVKIAYCPACAQDFAGEIDRPTYHRTGKKIK